MVQADNRTEKLRGAVISRKIDALIVTNIKNIRYLSGFTGSSAFVLITRAGSYFVTDFRYTEQAKHEVRGFELGVERGNRLAVIKGMLSKLGIGLLGFESGVTYDFYEQLKRLPFKLFPQKGLVEDLRMVKDARELGSIREAARRAEGALREPPRLRRGLPARAGQRLYLCPPGRFASGADQQRIQPRPVPDHAAERGS